MKTHFTLTGRYAGHTYCGEARNEIDNYIHIKSENSPIMKQMLNAKDSNLCIGCKSVYKESI